MPICHHALHYLSFYYMLCINVCLFYESYRASESESCSAESDNISFETSDIDSHQRIIIYGEIVGGVLTMAILKATMTMFICLSAASSLQDKMFKSILRAPMLFFETNPIGMYDDCVKFIV